MTSPILLEPRLYRDFTGDDRFVAFRVVVETSDLYVKALVPLQEETERLIRESRSRIEESIGRRREFLTSLVPIPEDAEDAPVSLRMVRAAQKAGTGPMAAVAGAVAEHVGRGLMQWTAEVMVENGGDLFLKVNEPVLIGLHAGASPLTGRIALRVEATPLPLGVCTSSATVGPSMSFGKADAATVLASDTALADAVASGLGNRIQRQADLKRAVEWAVSVPGVSGALAILGESIAAMGDVELVPIQR